MAKRDGVERPFADAAEKPLTTPFQDKLCQEGKESKKADEAACGFIKGHGRGVWRLLGGRQVEVPAGFGAGRIESGPIYQTEQPD